MDSRPSRKIIEFIDEWVEKYSGLPRTLLGRTSESTPSTHSDE